MSCAKSPIMPTRHLLGGNELPTKDKNTGWQAADTWAVFAQDAEGIEISASLHDALLGQHVWIWKAGCIENVTGHDEKGEDAILDQELAISTMDGVAIQTAMSAIVQCFRWLDRLRANSG